MPNLLHTQNVKKKIIFHSINKKVLTQWVLNTSVKSLWYGICLNPLGFLSLFVPQAMKQQKQSGEDSQEWLVPRREKQQTPGGISQMFP